MDNQSIETSTQVDVLITGATGFLGSRVVELFLAKGYSVRALVRKQSNIEQLRKLNVDICYGDIADIETLDAAFAGARFVIHAAAGTSGNEEEMRKNTVLGAQNVLALAARYKVEKLIYISSCSVYGVVDYQDHQLVDEDSALERFPEKRGAYSATKLEAEKLVRQAMKVGKTAIVCLRPGTIYGPGGDIYTPIIGFSLKDRFFVVIGNGQFILPLVYVDNLVDAIILSVQQEAAAGQVYNVVDSEPVSKKRFMDLVVRKVHPDAMVCYLPYRLLSGMVWLQEKVCALIKRKPFLTRYRLLSSQKPIVYTASKIVSELNWQPPYDLQKAVESLVASSLKT